MAETEGSAIEEDCLLETHLRARHRELTSQRYSQGGLDEAGTSELQDLAQRLVNVENARKGGDGRR